MKPTANNASIASVMLSNADAKTRFCNRRKSMIGSRPRRSTAGTTSKATTLTPKQRRELQELQPHSGANESASVISAKLPLSGVPTNLDLTSSPGDLKLTNPDNLDQFNTTLGNNGVGLSTTAWGGQTFTTPDNGNGSFIAFGTGFSTGVNPQGLPSNHFRTLLQNIR